MTGRPFTPRGRARAAGLAALLALAACAPADPPNSTFRPPDGSTINNPNPGIEVGPASGTILIEIRSPMEGAMAVLSTNAPADVDARITILNGNDFVDPATVHMTLTGASGETLGPPRPLVGPVGDAEFRGKLSLAGLATGDYTITISARSTGNAAASKSIIIHVDGGPMITVLSPIRDRSYKGSLVVQVVVEPGATDLQATIAGMPIMLQPSGQPNQFRAVFDLTMPVTLIGEQIFTVSAKNAAGTRTDIRFIFFVDGSGPRITMTSPEPGEIVGGVIKIRANIADPAGLNESSLQVIIGDKITPMFRLALKPDGGSTYSTLFDTKLLSTCSFLGGFCTVRPVISFRAADLLGNETNEAYTFAVDNFGPIADLDPPKIRDSKKAMGLRCSHEFDPLDHNIYSGDAPNDLCQVPHMFDLRARIQDSGNGDFGNGAAMFAEGIKAVPISEVDPDRTAVYILDNTTINGEAQALVVDTDNDGFCDAVNPKLETTTTPLTNPRQALKIRMRPVPPGGSADYATPDPNLPAGCLPGQDTDVPDDLCGPGPQPSIAIRYAGELPAIWTIEPVVPAANDGYCFGSQLDTFGNNITSVKQGGIAPALGWKCIAIVATDKAGNSTTSAPLRVYLDDYTYGGAHGFCKAPPPAAGPPPNCTGTFDRATGVVSNKACQSRSFKTPPGTSELCYNGECS